MAIFSGGTPVESFVCGGTPVESFVCGERTVVSMAGPRKNIEHFSRRRLRTGGSGVA